MLPCREVVSAVGAGEIREKGTNQLALSVQSISPQLLDHLAPLGAVLEGAVVDPRGRVGRHHRQSGGGVDHSSRLAGRFGRGGEGGEL